jgi:hypothetical protein
MTNKAPSPRQQQSKRLLNDKLNTQNSPGATKNGKHRDRERREPATRQLRRKRSSSVSCIPEQSANHMRTWSLSPTKKRRDRADPVQEPENAPAGTMKEPRETLIEPKLKDPTGIVPGLSPLSNLQAITGVHSGSDSSLTPIENIDSAHPEALAEKNRKRVLAKRPKLPKVVQTVVGHALSNPFRRSLVVTEKETDLQKDLEAIRPPEYPR